MDAAYIGGLGAQARRKKMRAGRGGIGKTIVAGMRDQPTNRVVAQVVDRADGVTLKKFIWTYAAQGARIYTDERGAYFGLPNHESVRHGRGEYVRGEVSTNGIESFWAILKPAHKGTFHVLSPKHLQRYLDEFAGKHNVRSLGTLDRMQYVASRLVGRRLLYRDLIA